MTFTACDVTHTHTHTRAHSRILSMSISTCDKCDMPVNILQSLFFFNGMFSCLLFCYFLFVANPFLPLIFCLVSVYQMFSSGKSSTDYSTECFLISIIFCYFCLCLAHSSNRYGTNLNRGNCSQCSRSTQSMSRSSHLYY